MNKAKLLFLFCALSALLTVSCMKQTSVYEPSVDAARANSSKSETRIQETAPVKSLEQIETAANVPIPLLTRKIDGYFPKNYASFPDDINFYVVNSKTQFGDKLSESISKKPVFKISFDKNIAAIIILKPSNYKNSIEINKAEYLNSTINVYCSISALEPKLYYSANNSAVFEIERRNPITAVNFYVNGKLKKEVLFGMRNKNSPKTLLDLKKSYMGVYKGSLPAADLSDMNVEVELYGNSTYVLKESRLLEGENKLLVFETKGKWIPTDDLSSVVLNSDKDKSEHIFLYFIDSGNIEFLDAYGDKNLTRQYRLKK